MRLLLDGIQGRGCGGIGTFRSSRPDGREVPIEINTSLLEDETGQTTGLLGIFRDLSLVRELEQRLRRADRLAAVGRMAAMVAHEIKNPLVALKTFVDMVPRRAKDPAFIARFQDIVPREVDRVNAIMEELLESQSTAPYFPAAASMSMRSSPVAWRSTNNKRQNVALPSSRNWHQDSHMCVLIRNICCVPWAIWPSTLSRL